MKAIYNGAVIAEAPKEDLIYIEQNWYFPPSSIKKEFLTESSTTTECFWKGTACYYNVVVDGQVNEDAAFYYAEPMDGSTQKVKKDFTNYVAFWRGVQVSE